MQQTLKNLTTNRHVHICAALIAADIVVFSAVNPRSASAVWLITGYLLLAVTVFGLAGLAAQSLKGYGGRAHALAKRASRYAAVAIIALIGLQSVGQLTVRDVLTLLPLVVGAYLYIGYGKKLAAERASSS